MKIRVAVLPLLLAFAAPLTAQQTDSSQVSVEERAYVAGRLYAAVPQYFAHWEGLPAGFDLHRHYRDYLSRALAAPDRRAFSLESMAFLPALRNGHTHFREGRRKRQQIREPLPSAGNPL